MSHYVNKLGPHEPNATLFGSRARCDNNQWQLTIPFLNRTWHGSGFSDLGTTSFSDLIWMFHDDGALEP